MSLEDHNSLFVAMILNFLILIIVRKDIALQ